MMAITFGEIEVSDADPFLTNGGEIATLRSASSWAISLLMYCLPRAMVSTASTNTSGALALLAHSYDKAAQWVGFALLPATHQDPCSSYSATAIPCRGSQTRTRVPSFGAVSIGCHCMASPTRARRSPRCL